MGNLHRNICVLILLPVPHAVPKECLTETYSPSSTSRSTQRMSYRDLFTTSHEKTKQSLDCICVIHLLIESRAKLKCDPETSVITAAAHTFTKERTHYKVGHRPFSVNSVPASQRTYSVSIIKQSTVQCITRFVLRIL